MPRPKRSQPDGHRHRRGQSDPGQPIPGSRPAPSSAPRGRGSDSDDHPAEATSAPRIIGGELRHRRLEFNPDPRTRPMKERVRESLFNLLGFEVRGAIALDLFAGTGALGFEALSRGATAAWFVERHFPTADTLRRSARTLDISDRCTIRSGDVLLWARRMPELPRSAPWVAFISPPWEMFESQSEALLELVAVLIREAPPGSTIVVEAEIGFDPALLPTGVDWEPRQIPPALLIFGRLPRVVPPSSPAPDAIAGHSGHSEIGDDSGIVD